MLIPNLHHFNKSNICDFHRLRYFITIIQIKAERSDSLHLNFYVWIEQKQPWNKRLEGTGWTRDNHGAIVRESQTWATKKRGLASSSGRGFSACSALQDIAFAAGGAAQEVQGTCKKESRGGPWGCSQAWSIPAM